MDEGHRRSVVIAMDGSAHSAKAFLSLSSTMAASVCLVLNQQRLLSEEKVKVISHAMVKIGTRYVHHVHKPGDNAVLLTVADVRDGFTSTQWTGLMECFDSGITDRVMNEQRDKVDKYLKEMAEMMEDAKIHGVAKCVHASSPAKGLLAAAEECGASCIITGSRGLGCFKRAILGSTSELVLHNSTVPVIVCPQ